MVLDSHQERVDQNGEQNDLREDVTDHELVEPVTKVKDNNEGARPRDPLETAEAKEFEWSGVSSWKRLGFLCPWFVSCFRLLALTTVTIATTATTMGYTFLIQLAKEVGNELEQGFPLADVVGRALRLEGGCWRELAAFFEHQLWLALSGLAELDWNDY